MIDWRPIETAPGYVSDVSEFLVWNSRQGTGYIVQWMNADTLLYDYGGHANLSDFTHWAPLTPPEGQ